MTGRVLHTLDIYVPGFEVFLVSYAACPSSALLGVCRLICWEQVGSEDIDKLYDSGMM